MRAGPPLLFSFRQTAYMFVAKMGALDLLSAPDVFAVLVSAIACDLEHPGLNNAYQVNAGTDLAMRFNDLSVLENHHCAVLFGILEDFDIMAGLSLVDRQHVWP